MVHPAFEEALAQRYPDLKVRYPHEGRRKRCLRVLHESWPSLNAKADGSHDEISQTIAADPDPSDQLLEDDELGLVIRIDFSNDEAWNVFIQKVKASQGELLADLRDPPKQEDEPMEESSDAHPDGPEGLLEDEDDSGSDIGELSDFLKVVNPTEANERSQLTNISNINALRLFNDVDVREAPPIPSDGKKVSQGNPLIDQGGWQEVYTGKNLWLYDELSNLDECARVVRQCSDFYGTATGDSWRAKASHIPELQFGIAYQGLKIDFNGLDKWDFNERTRNLRDAVIL